MKRIIKISATLYGIVFLAAMTAIPVSAQSMEKGTAGQKAIPPEVMKVMNKSCAKCHLNNEMKMTPGGFNLAAWDKYSAEKQADRARAMCIAISDKSMPPKNFLNNNPGATPTADDIKTVCSWSGLSQAAKK